MPVLKEITVQLRPSHPFFPEVKRPCHCSRDQSFFSVPRDMARSQCQQANHSAATERRSDTRRNRRREGGREDHAAPYLGALLLVEVGGAGVEHHGLDGEVLGVLLPVALLHLPLHLTDPCTTQQGHQTPPRKPKTPHLIASYSPPSAIPCPCGQPPTTWRNSKRICDPRVPSAYHSRRPSRGRGRRPSRRFLGVFSLFSFVL
jgi:hypothetical protein